MHAASERVLGQVSSATIHRLGKLVATKKYAHLHGRFPSLQIICAEQALGDGGTASPALTVQAPTTSEKERSERTHCAQSSLKI